MESKTLNNIGIQGLATDPQPWTLPAEFITYGRNFRIYAGSIITRGGYKVWSAAPTQFFPAHPFHVGSTSGSYWLIAGRTAIYAFDGVNWFDVSSTAGYATLNEGDEYLWSSCIIGSIPIMNNPQAYPEFWSPQQTNQIMQPLIFDGVETWADKQFSAKMFRSHKNFLFALNLTEVGVEMQDTFRWSHPADINSLPVTWDEENDAFLAGKSPLGGDGGAIIDGQSLRDAFCIYSESAIDMLDYTNDEFVWRRRELSSTVGLLSTNCIVEVKGTHFFLSDGDVVKNDGNEIVSIAHNRIRTEMTRRIDVNNYLRSYAVRNDALKEIWFCIPDSGDDVATLAYVYNWKDDSWAIRDLPNVDDAPGFVAYSGYGSQLDPVEAWDDFPTNQTWDTQIRSWGSAKRTPLNDTIVGASPSNALLVLMDPGDAPDADYNARIERTDFALEGDRQVTTITRVYPHMKGEGTVNIQFGSQDFPNAPVRWKPAVSFEVGKDRKIDVITTGELHAWRFDTFGKIGWIMSGMTFEYERSGFR